jgi:hypothetical protein
MYWLTGIYCDHCKLRLHISRFEFEMKVSPPHLELIVTSKTWSVMVNAAVLLTPYTNMANIVLLIAERASVVPSFVEVCFERWFRIHTLSRKHWVISAAFTRIFSIVIKILTTIHCCWYYQYTAIVKVCVLLRHNEIYTDFSSSTV